jgi:hypothetical protein
VAVKAVGGTDPVPVYLALPYRQPGRTWHLVNLDSSTTVFYEDTPSVSATSNQLLPLGGATFDGSSDVWCSTVGGPAVLVQTGIRGQRGWSAGPMKAALSIQQLGVPPKIPGLKSAVILSQSAQPPTTFFTFPAAGTVWGAHTSFAAAANASYSGGTTQLYARTLLGSGLTLGGPIEIAIGGPQTNANGDGDLGIGGIAVAKNDTLQLDVNNGNPMTNGVMHASAVVFYSTP